MSVNWQDDGPQTAQELLDAIQLERERIQQAKHQLAQNADPLQAVHWRAVIGESSARVRQLQARLKEQSRAGAGS